MGNCGCGKALIVFKVIIRDSEKPLRQKIAMDEEADETGHQV